MHIYVGHSGILGLLLLIADIYAIVSTVQGNTTTGKKVAWILLILFLPMLGFIIWWLAGPRSK
ncbi:MAG: PLD nuclease N-terminal domain-containing protein [Stenotrophobium sp.]